MLRVLLIVLAGATVCAGQAVQPFSHADVRTTASRNTISLPGDYDGFAVTYSKWESTTINCAQLAGHMFGQQLGMASAKEPTARTFRVVFSNRVQPWVGPDVPELDALDDEGFVIRTLQNGAGRTDGIQFASKSVIGQYWAMSYFFHNVIGARWVLPGNVGEVVPPGPWEIPARYEVIHPGPPFMQRTLLTERLYLFVKEKAFGRIQPMLYLNSQGGYSRFEYHHNLLRIFDPAKYAEDHPDYYPMIHGKRNVPTPENRSGWQPCMTHPDAVGVTMAYARELFAEKPYLRSLSLAVNDSRGFCNCDRCLALGDPATPLYAGNDAASGRTYSRQYYHYVRNVAAAFAAEFPDRFVTVLPYQDVADPPTEALPDNVLCVYFGNPSDNPTRFARWRKTVKHFGMYLWIGSDWVWPGGFSRRDAQTYLREMRDIGAVLFKAEPTSNYCLGGVNMWVVSNLLWDVNADVDALVRDYCVASFGEEAGAHIAVFYAELEAIHQRLYPGRLWQQWAPGEVQFEGVTDADVAVLRGMINRALAADTTTAQRRRLEMFDITFAHTEHFFRRYWQRKQIAEAKPVTVADVRQWLEQIAVSRQLIAEHEAFMREKLTDLEWYAWVGHENKEKDIVYRINGRYRLMHNRPTSALAEPVIDRINGRVQSGALPADLWSQMAQAYPDLSDLIEQAGAMADIGDIDAMENLLGNGSFEVPLGPLRTAGVVLWDNWLVYHNRNISATVDLDDENAMQGPRCVRIAGATSCSGVHQLVKVKGGHRYMLTGWVRGTAGRLRVSASTGSEWPNIYMPASPTWSRFRLFLTGEGNTDQAYPIWLNLDVRGAPGDHDEWFIDDVRLVDLSAAANKTEVK